MPLLALYVLPLTCSPSLPLNVTNPRESLQLESIDFVHGMDRIPKLLATHEASCSLHSARFLSIQHGLAIPQAAKDELYQTKIEVCAFLQDLSSDLRNYYRHANILAETVLREVDATQTQILTAMMNNHSSTELAVEQQMLHEKMIHIITQWDQNYAFLEPPGRELGQGVRLARKKVARLLTYLEMANSTTQRDRQETIKKWNVARRFGRFVGWLRLDPPELFARNDALRAVEELYIETKSLEIVLTLVWINVTGLQEGMKDLAITRFSADVQSQLGSTGLVNLHRWMTETGAAARSIHKTTDDARTRSETQLSEEGSL